MDSPRKPIDVALLLAIVVSLALVGCAKNANNSTSTDTVRYGNEFLAICNSGRILLDTQEREIQEKIETDVRTRQDVVADFILADGTWKQLIWFKFAEEDFANAWRLKTTPITVPASPRTIEALRHVAVKGLSREARVAAALAIADIDPKVSLGTLTQEYATFEVLYFEDPRRAYPLGTGEALLKMGVMTVPEVTSHSEFRRLIETFHGKVELDEKRLVRATNFYNKQLRELFVGNDKVSIENLQAMPSRSDMALHAYRTCPAESETQRGPFSP